MTSPEDKNPVRGGVNMGRALETQPKQGDRCFLVVARRYVLRAGRHVDPIAEDTVFCQSIIIRRARTGT